MLRSLLLRISTSTQSAGWGVGFMTTGMIIVPVMDAIAKILGDSLSPMQITWGRFAFQMIFMAAAILLTLQPSALKPARPFMHTVRGILLATATTFFFFSLLYLPLATAIAIFFVQPMILTLLSALVLGESIGWHRRIAVTTGFLGTLLIIRPGSDAFTLASLLPVAAAFFFASYLAMTRSVANVDHPLTMQFSSAVGATVVMTLALWVGSFSNMAIFQPQLPDLEQWGLLAAVGLIAAVGHLLVVIAVNRAPTSLLAPFGYIEIISATALGWWIFNEWPDSMTWAGIAVIVASGLYVIFRENQLKKSTLTHTP
ncbi:MAG: DMT family transporter [Granulosicoccus sp.]